MLFTSQSICSVQTLTELIHCALAFGRTRSLVQGGSIYLEAGTSWSKTGSQSTCSLSDGSPDTVIKHLDTDIIRMIMM